MPFRGSFLEAGVRKCENPAQDPGLLVSIAASSSILIALSFWISAAPTGSGRAKGDQGAGLVRRSLARDRAFQREVRFVRSIRRLDNEYLRSVYPKPRFYVVSARPREADVPFVERQYLFRVDGGKVRRAGGEWEAADRAMGRGSAAPGVRWEAAAGDGYVAESVLADVAAFNEGLKPARSVDERRYVAAAVLSLLPSIHGGLLSPRHQDLAVEETASGWTVAYEAMSGVTLSLRFDREGRLCEVRRRTDKGTMGPQPICLGGLFEPVGRMELAALGIPAEQGGVRVVSTQAGSVAERGGLEPGDVIVGFEGRPLPGEGAVPYLRSLVLPLRGTRGAMRRAEVLRAGRRRRFLLSW